MSKLLCLSEISDYINNNKENNLTIIQKFLLEKINSIEDNNFKELCIFFTDDLLSQSYKEKWQEFLLEEKIFQTRIGGNLFFDRLNFFLKTNNLEYIHLYTFAMKLGFVGQYFKFPASLYCQCIGKMELPFDHQNQFYTSIINNTKRTKNKNHITLTILLIFAALFLIWNIVEIYTVKIFSRKILAIGEGVL